MNYIRYLITSFYRAENYQPEQEPVKPDKILKLNYNIENINPYTVNLTSNVSSISSVGYSRIETGTTPLYDDDNIRVGTVSFYRFYQSLNGSDVYLTEKGNYIIGERGNSSIISYENCYETSDASVPFNPAFYKFNVWNTFGEYLDYTGTIELNLVQQYQRNITIFLYKKTK